METYEVQVIIKQVVSVWIEVEADNEIEAEGKAKSQYFDKREEYDIYGDELSYEAGGNWELESVQVMLPVLGRG